MVAVDDAKMKTAVRAFWQEAPCGTPDVLDRAEEDRYRELEQIRYGREPFIEKFARFSAWKEKRILEVGSGAGTDLLNFARAGALCSAVDLTEAGVALARRRLMSERLEADVRVGDAENLPFEDNSFDFVYSWGVIHHTPDTRRAAREIVRVLRPGGEFSVMVYNRHSLLALQAWLFYGVARAKPWRTLADVIASHVESPGTKAYTDAEAKALFPEVEHLEVHTVVTAYDLRIGRRRFLPSWTHKWVPSRLGWFHVVTGRKPETLRSSA